ncbi:MAG: hypothetical protein ACP5JR_05035 [Thermoplasmata archaeon]
MKFWVNILHIYQPPIQSKYWVRRIAKECYLPLLRVLSENPEVHLTLNISGVLVEHLHNLEINQFFELIDRIKAGGNIEFTGSAAYHPILPMLPVEECIRQIYLNEKILKEYMGINRLEGFFIPEMCYSREVGEIINQMGYRWLVLDEIACPGHEYGVLEGTGLKLVFRNRELSNALNTRAFHLKDLTETYAGKERSFWITATDGEIYGHHKKLFWQIFKEVVSSDIKTLSVSEFLAGQKTLQQLNPIPCSWASTKEELWQGIPYPRWYNRNNELHMLQWAITIMGLKSGMSAGNFELRELLDKSIFSCQYYWANPGLLWFPGMILNAQKLWRKIFEICGKLDSYLPIYRVLCRKVQEYENRYKMVQEVA